MSIGRDSSSRSNLGALWWWTTLASVADFELVQTSEALQNYLLRCKIRQNNRGLYNAHAKQLQKLWSATSLEFDIQSTIRVAEAFTKPTIYRLILTLVGSSLPSQPQKSSLAKFFLSTPSQVSGTH